MRRIFLLLALVAVAASGCATVPGGRVYSFNFFPTVDVVIVNNCVGSMLYVKPPQGTETAVPFGNAETIRLHRYPGDDNRFVLVARGIGTDGAYLGSATRTFYTGQSGRREESWIVGYLQGGQRPCR